MKVMKLQNCFVFFSYFSVYWCVENDGEIRFVKLLKFN